MNATHLVIFNRAPAGTADGWIHVVPKGELPNREAGIVQVLDDQSLDSILGNIAADKARLGNNWPGVYAGREHFIYNDEQDSAALAWFKDFEKRGDGIWARDDGLTDIGHEAVANRRYKFTSFVADRKDTQKLDGNKVRILKIDTIGFTNQANGRELLTPITNRKPGSAPATGAVSGAPAGNPPPSNVADACAPADSQKKKNQTTMKNLIANRLNVSADAPDESFVRGVNAVCDERDTLKTEITTLKNRLTALETENQTLLGEQIDADFATAGITDEKIINRHKPLLADRNHFKNRAERVEFLKDLAKPAKATNAQTQLRNRDTKPPGGKAGPADETDERALSEKITNRAAELKGTAPARSFESCWSQAKRELTPK